MINQFHGSDVKKLKNTKRVKIMERKPVLTVGTLFPAPCAVVTVDVNYRSCSEVRQNPYGAALPPTV